MLCGLSTQEKLFLSYVIQFTDKNSSSSTTFCMIIFQYAVNHKFQYKFVYKTYFIPDQDFHQYKIIQVPKIWAPLEVCSTKRPIQYLISSPSRPKERCLVFCCSPMPLPNYSLHIRINSFILAAIHKQLRKTCKAPVPNHTDTRLNSRTTETPPQSRKRLWCLATSAPTQMSGPQS